MEKYFSNVKIEDGTLIFNYKDEFKFHEEEFSFCLHNIDRIRFSKGKIEINQAINNIWKEFSSSNEDVEEIKNVLRKISNFVECGNSVFNIDNIISFCKGKEDNEIDIECYACTYMVYLKNKEQANALINAIQNKWQTMIDEWNKTEELRV